ncbi:MAG: 50S ribosomal protein L21 [Spirochaetes bacterium]|nr:50S ribosomal protein L21 [Spirochaetota bacterium]
MYAICEIKGKQYKIETGKEYRVDYLNMDKDNEINFNTVLLIRDDNGNIKVGNPYLDGVNVKAKIVVPMIKGDKVIAFKYKRRKGYRNKKGHRQQYSVIRIEKIE